MMTDSQEIHEKSENTQAMAISLALHGQQQGCLGLFQMLSRPRRAVKSLDPSPHKNAEGGGRLVSAGFCA